MWTRRCFSPCTERQCLSHGIMFCPYCANLLVVEPFDGAMRFACKTCPYHYNIGKRLKKAAHIEQKKVPIPLIPGTCLDPLRQSFFDPCFSKQILPMLTTGRDKLAATKGLLLTKCDGFMSGTHNLPQIATSSGLLPTTYCDGDANEKCKSVQTHHKVYSSRENLANIYIDIHMHVYLYACVYIYI